MYRLFIGLEVPPAQQRQLELLAKASRGHESPIQEKLAQWVNAPNFHLTLRAIGMVDGVVADHVHEALSQIKITPFSLTIKGVGQFAQAGLIHTLWAGVEKNLALMALQKKISTTMDRLGIDYGRRHYAPHITLAHFREGVAPEAIIPFLEQQHLLELPRFGVENIALFQSFPHREGAYYKVLWRYQ